MKDHKFKLRRKRWMKTVVFLQYGYITNSQRDHLPDGLIAHLVEHRTGIAEVMGSIPVQA